MRATEGVKAASTRVLALMLGAGGTAERERAESRRLHEHRHHGRQ